MKLLTIFGIVLLLVAIPFLLVRLDIISAEYLRFIPALIAIFIGITLVILGTKKIKRK